MRVQLKVHLRGMAMARCDGLFTSVSWRLYEVSSLAEGIVQISSEVCVLDLVYPVVKLVDLILV